MWTNRRLPTLGRRALVLGSSMAGLLAARILSERYDEVWLLERDVLPESAAARKGTPQALHAHGLLARGRMVLEELFPGTTAALAAQGAMVGDVQANAPFVAAGRRFARGAPCGTTGLACSRLAIEAEVRCRVLALPGVKALTGVDIVQPALDDARGRVTGLRLDAAASPACAWCSATAARSRRWPPTWWSTAPGGVRARRHGCANGATTRRTKSA